MWPSPCSTENAPLAIKKTKKEYKALKNRILIVAILLLSLLLLCSCADAEKNEGEGGLKIVTTVFPQYDFAQKITEGTDAEVTMLLKTGSEPHSYEPTPKDIVTLLCHVSFCRKVEIFSNLRIYFVVVHIIILSFKNYPTKIAPSESTSIAPSESTSAFNPPASYTL